MDKKNTLKNYLILGAIIFVTLLLTFYLLNWYKNYRYYKIVTPVLTNTVTEVKYKELDAFLSERDITILYMCTAKENKCRNFEKKFENYIINHNLRDDIFYFNMDGHNNNSFLNDFYVQYKSDDLIKKMSDYPIIAVFKDNKMIDILSSKDDLDITISDVADFLKDYVDLI